MAKYVLFVSILVLIELNKCHDAHDINTPSQSDPRNQLLINTTSTQTQRPLLTLEALMNESLITTNPTNNIPTLSDSNYSITNSSEDTISANSSASITSQSRQMTLLTLIGTAIFITAAILIIRARYGICKNQIIKRSVSVSEVNIAQSIENHEAVKPALASNPSQQGVAADNMVYGSDGSGESALGTPQSRPSGNGIGINIGNGSEHAEEIRLSIADSVNKHNHNHKSPKGSDSMNRKIKEYLQSQLHDNEIAGHRSRLSVASAHAQQWKMILNANNQNQLPSMEHQASSATLSSKYGEHTHTMTKSIDIGDGLSFAEYQHQIHVGVGQKMNINALQEDEEMDVFEVRQPGSPCPRPYVHIQHVYHDSLDDHQNLKHIQSSIIKIPNKPERKIRTTDGIAEDEFVVDDGESSHDMMTHGEVDVDIDEIAHDGDGHGHKGHEANDTDPDIPDSHDSDNDIIMDMDMNTKGFIE